MNLGEEQGRPRWHVPPDLLTPVVLRLHGDGEDYARSRVTIRSHVVTIDEPAERGGTDQGPAPTETLIAALIGVTNVILRRIARRDAIAVRALQIEAAAELDRRGVWLAEALVNPWNSIAMKLHIDTDADDSRLDLWQKDLGRFSPIHSLMRAAGTEIIEQWIRL